MNNKKYIEKIQAQLTNIVSSLNNKDYSSFFSLSTQYFQNRVEKFGDSPDFPSMNIREKIYPGMYFYNLLIADLLTTKRWDYWGNVLLTKDLSGDIPYVDFGHYNKQDGIEVADMLKNCIDVPHCGGSTAFNNFVRYLLYCLKPVSYYEGDTIKEKEEEAEKLLAGIDDKSLKNYYENFSLEAMLLYPGDYLGELAAAYLGSNGSEYYPTPNNIVQLMVELLMKDGDSKFDSICDPCCGSSRMLLYASNKSLKVFGMDINKDIINVSLVNAFLYIPWAVCTTDEVNKLIYEVSDIDNEDLMNIQV